MIAAIILALAAQEAAGQSSDVPGWFDVKSLCGANTPYHPPDIRLESIDLTSKPAKIQFSVATTVFGVRVFLEHDGQAEELPTRLLRKDVDVYGVGHYGAALGSSVFSSRSLYVELMDLDGNCAMDYPTFLLKINGALS